MKSLKRIAVFIFCVFNLGSLSFAQTDNCDDPGIPLINLIPPTTGFAFIENCITGSLENATSEPLFTHCDQEVNPTVWFEFTTDFNAEFLFLKVTPQDNWVPRFTLYEGNNCFQNSDAITFFQFVITIAQYAQIGQKDEEICFKIVCFYFKIMFQF